MTDTFRIAFFSNHFIPYTDSFWPREKLAMNKSRLIEWNIKPLHDKKKKKKKINWELSYATNLKFVHFRV